MKKLLLSLLFLGLFSVSGYAATFTVSWDANTEPSVTGYKVHYGTAHATFTDVIDVGNVLTHTLDLPIGTYYITVTAYDAAGNESDYAYELVYELKISQVKNIVGG